MVQGRRRRIRSRAEGSNIADDLVVVKSKIKNDRILPRQRLYTSFGSFRVCGVLAGLHKVPYSGMVSSAVLV